MKKILLHYYSRMNFGDDLFVELFSKQFNDHEIHVLGNPLYLPQGLSSNVRISFWSWPLTAIGKLQSVSFLSKRVKIWLYAKYDQIVEYTKRKSDAYVKIGGSLFPDYKSSAETERSFSIPESCPRDFAFNSRAVSGRKEFIIGANLGPVFHADYFERMRAVFSQYAHVCLRDYASYYPFRDDPHVQYAPDVGFLHVPVASPQGSDAVVISVMDVSHHTKDAHVVETYDAFMADIATRFASMGRSVVLLSLCKREGDENAVQRIMSLIPNRTNIRVYSYAGNISEVTTIFSRASLVVATRFHSMIMGLVHNKPVFPVAYNCKMEHYLQDLCFRGPFATLETLKNFTVNDVENTAVCDCSRHKQYAHVQFEALKQYLKD